MTKQGGIQGALGGFLSGFKIFLDRRMLGELLVVKGSISSQELRHALKLQKASGQPLGHVLVAHSMITRRELATALARQTALRLVAAALLMSAGLLAGKRAQAGDGSITSVSAIGSYHALLGTGEKRSSDLSAFTKWRSVFARFDSEKGSAAMQAWNENIRDMQGLPLMEMARRVNDRMNEQPYIIDSKNWGRSDYWSTPVEFMRRGGDCEDFAIAKYIALMQLGVPEERMRLAIVQDTYKNIPHAVLALYTDQGIYILDQQIKTLVNGEAAGRYKPIFSINRMAWWLHTAPDATQIAAR